MVKIKSQPVAIDYATGLQRYGILETRFLVYLCNYLNKHRSSLRDSEFFKFIQSEIILNIDDLVSSLGLMQKDGRRIFTKSHESFMKGIENNEDGLWVAFSEYWNGNITIKVSQALIDQYKENNPYLYNFDLSTIRGINSLSAIRFINYLYANKFHTKHYSEIKLSLDDIRAIFGVEDSYTCLSNIRSKIIGKSIEITNKHTKFNVYVKRKSSEIKDLNYYFVIETAI